MGWTKGTFWGARLMLVASACAAPPQRPARSPAAPDGETFRYCAGTVTEWDVDQCVWELTPEQQRQRPYSQRLVYRAGRLERMEAISGSGALDRESETATMRYDGKRVAGWVKTNRNGVLKGTSEAAEGGVWVRFLDSQGRPRVSEKKKKSTVSGLKRTFDARGRVLSFTYVNSEGNPTEQEGVYLVAKTRNAIGAVVEERYFGFGDAPVSGPAGAHRVVHEVDEHGVDLSIRYYDAKGQPTLAQGAHVERLKNDANGNILETRFFDVQGAPTRSEYFGAAIVRRVRDARGNLTSLALFDEQERPVVGATHFAVMKRRYDAQDLLIESAYFGVDGAPLRLKDLGNAILRQTRDARGNVIVERFYDERGAPMLGTEHYHRVDIAYDQRDNPVSFRYFDLNGARATVASGYYERQLTYDGDRLTRTAYFDAAGSLVNIDKGYAVIEQDYGADGSDNERRFLKANGEPATGGCQGTIGPELTAEISERARATRSCYEKLLSEQPTAQGRVMIELTINSNATVSGATLSKDELAVPSFATCVTTKMRRAYDHQPTGGCAQVRIPLVFQPTKAPGSTPSAAEP